MQYGFFQDTIISFEKKSPYPDEMNSHGYRTHEINDENLNQPHWYLFGESNVYGWGINKHDRFSDRLETNLQQKVFNFARPGASCEECVRILYGLSQIDQLPKGIILVWPYLLRRNHYTIANGGPTYLVGNHRDKNMLKHLVNNDEDMDIANFLHQIFFAEYWAKLKKVPVYHFMVDQKDGNMLKKKHILDTHKVCETGFSDCADSNDLANDKSHWGKLHHKIFTFTIMNWIGNS